MWVTASPFLATQIKRDVKDVGLRIPILELSKFPLAGRPDLSGEKAGLMICTYRGLLGGMKDEEGEEDDGEFGGGGGGAAAEEEGPSRLGQLISWVGGEGWEGVLALDEAHKVCDDRQGLGVKGWGSVSDHSTDPWMN